MCSPTTDEAQILAHYIKSLFFFLSYQPFLSPKTQQKQIREQMVFIYETKTSNKILKYVLVDEFVRNRMKLRQIG